MPAYINNYTKPVYYGKTVFAPNQETQTYDVLDNRAFIVGTILETFNIGPANEVLMLRFNDETAWTTVTLTNGVAQSAADIVADINTAYGDTVASDEGGRVRIDASIRNNILSAVYIATAGTGSTAAATLGLVTNDVNPIALEVLESFIISSNAEAYNITVNNNTFIFKFNVWSAWITATLTTGAAQTAAQIAADINNAYETATADATKVAYAVTPVAGGSTYVKLVALPYNNIKSRIYIKSTKNTALTVLGFTGNDFDPIVESSFPTLVKTSDLPLYNPIIAETTITFGAAGTQYYYIVSPENAKELQFIRIGGGGGVSFSCYIESLSNTPPFTLAANETFSIKLLNYRISRIGIVANMAGNLTIRELEG